MVKFDDGDVMPRFIPDIIAPMYSNRRAPPVLLFRVNYRILRGLTYMDIDLDGKRVLKTIVYVMRSCNNSIIVNQPASPPVCLGILLESHQ